MDKAYIQTWLEWEAQGQAALEEWRDYEWELVIQSFELRPLGIPQPGEVQP